MSHAESEGPVSDNGRAMMTREQIEEWKVFGIIPKGIAATTFASRLADLALRGLEQPTAEEVREACARVCDSKDEAGNFKGDGLTMSIWQGRADAIRALDLTTLKERADEK